MANPIVNQIAWYEYSDTAFNAAKQQNKPVLLYVHALWCSHCKNMDSTTLQDEAVIAYIENNYIPINVDINQQEELAASYKVLNLPTIIIMDENKRILSKITGYVPSQVFLEKLKQLKN